MYQVVAFRKSCSRNHGSTLLVRKRKFDVSRKKSRSISDLLNLYAAKNDLNSVAESLKLPPFQFASKNVFPPLEGAVVCSIKSNCVDIKCKARDRGNTQTSLDSGVITDSNMAASPFHRKTPSVTAPSRRPTSPNATASSCSPPLLLVKNQPNKSNDEWRFFGPKGKLLVYCRDAGCYWLILMRWNRPVWLRNECLVNKQRNNMLFIEYAIALLQRKLDVSNNLSVLEVILRHRTAV